VLIVVDNVGITLLSLSRDSHLTERARRLAHVNRKSGAQPEDVVWTWSRYRFVFTQSLATVRLSGARRGVVWQSPDSHRLILASGQCPCSVASPYSEY
jgi:hypothetical protein